MADITTSSGTHIYIGPTVTTAQSDTLGEYQAMSGWTEIGLVESLGAFGDKSSAITFAAINDARMRKQKGVRDAGDMTISVAYDSSDPGQTAMEAAEAAAGAYAFKVLLPDAANTVKYFRAYVMQRPLNVGGSNAVVKRDYMLAIDSPIYTSP